MLCSLHNTLRYFTNSSIKKSISNMKNEQDYGRMRMKIDTLCYLLQNKKSIHYIAKHFSLQTFCSQLFEGTAFCLTVCCRLYVLLITFKNNI